MGYYDLENKRHRYTDRRTKKAYKLNDKEKTESITRSEPELSATIIDLKKIVSTQEFKFARVTVLTEIYGNCFDGSTIPETFALSKYFASIRGLIYNYEFIKKLLKVHNIDQLNALTSESFDYRGNNMPNAIASSNKRSYIHLDANTLLKALEDSISIVEKFENKLNKDILSVKIRNFDSVYEKTTIQKEKTIALANNLANLLKTPKCEILLNSINNIIASNNAIKVK